MQEIFDSYFYTEHTYLQPEPKDHYIHIPIYYMCTLHSYCMIHFNDFIAPYIHAAF